MEAAGDRFVWTWAGSPSQHAERRMDAMRRFLAAIGGGDAGGLVTSLPAEGTTFWDWIKPAEKLPAWISEDELDVFATEFERTGFTGGINWYRNFHRNWQINESWGSNKIEMPAAFIAGEKDPVLVMTMSASSSA